MIALPRPGDEVYERSQRLVRRRPRPNKEGVALISIAYHAPIAHVLGAPCIFIAPKPRWSRYPLIHERNVVKVLIHEGLHCGIQRALGFNDLTQDAQAGIDAMFPEVGDL